MGLDQKTYDLLQKEMTKFFLKYKDVDNVETMSKTDTLKKFIDSEEFKVFNLDETNNSYFLLGYLFAQVVKFVQHVKTREQMDEVMTSLLEHAGHEMEKAEKKKGSGVN